MRDHALTCSTEGSVLMPPQVTWLHKVSEILDTLRAIPHPVIDRRTIERLFDLRPRRTLQWMNRWGAYKIGNLLFVDKERLCSELQVMITGGPAHYAATRKENIEDLLEKAAAERRQARLNTRIRPEIYATTWEKLSEGTELDRNGHRLIVNYRDGADLVQKLFEVAQAMMNNPEALD